MTHLFRKKNETIFGTGNSPLAGGRVHYYIAGTTTRHDTYADQAGSTINDNPVILNADGDFPTNVYLGEANDYKEVIETSDSSSSTTIDNIPKAQAATTTLLVQSPSFVWTTVLALNTILDETQVGKAFAANTQNNNVTFLLPNPALSQNGPTLVFKKINSSNDLILQDHLGGAFLTISNDDDSVLLSSNGAEWHIVSYLNSSQGGAIADDAVTNAKLANVGSGTIKGRLAAGTGDPEDLSPVDATSLLNEFSPDNGTNLPGVKGLVPAPAIGDASNGKILSANGTWIDPPSGGGGSTSLNPADGDLVGVNATADTTNRLSVSSPATLFNHEGNGHQHKINKNAAADTASVLFQTNFSGRAEFGLTGDDDFHMKVSPDGSTFHDAIIIDKDTGHTNCSRLFSGSIVIPDDSVGSIITPYAGGFFFILINDPAYPQISRSGVFVFDVGLSRSLDSIYLGALMSNLGTITVDGTTGTDGETSITARPNAIDIENRFGSTRTYTYTFIG